jgi:hypothetical protein
MTDIHKNTAACRGGIYPPFAHAIVPFANNAGKQVKEQIPVKGIGKENSFLDGYFKCTMDLLIVNF